MELSVINQTDVKEFEQYEEDFYEIAKRTWKVLERNDDVSFAVIFIDDEEIHVMNREYRGVDRPTDVITFALQDEMSELESMYEEIEQELGDIFISVDTAKRQAEEYGHSLRREVCFLFTHGLLHLLGYDHMTEEDEKVMFALQDTILDGWVSRC
jgi:probable rRNA maturation factor